MARQPIATARPTAVLSDAQLRAALPKLKRRLDELTTLNVFALTEKDGRNILDSHSTKINSTLRDIFGVDTLEYSEYSVETFQPVFGIWYSGMDDSLLGNISTVENKVTSCITTLKSVIEIFEERLGDEGESSIERTARAYDGLDLHREIARAANKLYQDGHYANAVEAAVKALNGLVRLRSGLEFDGTTLMERAFSPSNPILKFNALQDQSDRDEQKGFMQLFSGAVSGLRNPRAHGFINDDAERALEFIAFVSLLAKLLDVATT
ncbi:TIGR02391 family protein [Mesorhizobium sp. M7A.F.Ca.US.001.04.1.1]|uniref:TIGR02391 family protein n=1 Tax=unclassified Mesorhizobium TaxID=325217 RepID=UPI000FCC7F3B|nr:MULTISPECIES: TIGR02391 family protein [unclassified Mesorhizobium]RUY32211.1 TIGR02391 family protein [Mesorhizobium sp. M7A.F.Ca.US.001.04.2.1]RUY42117.1 TIGR02391 family protein [Mesorhizobium sp. M7A.F.Ca.US.001.04.1.1]